MASRNWLPVAVGAVILAASLVPGGGGGATIGPVGVDKLLHGAGYAALAAATLFARRARMARVFLAVVVAVTVFGGVVELLQGPVPGRHVSALDLVADAVGALAGGAAWWLFGGVDDSARPGPD
ncbi:VanZ family protein [Halolamina salifodinae]|uniref:VanZ family protein n=1 Tax=Halolamina salifodinae TaxID=1202767 RepID=A0A8T4H2J4_9EURY|nr:VanZ family protein [Halolamina salifodinae]MBP1987845.1 hypothetical protein [Halolamina salifodinae]